MAFSLPKKKAVTASQPSHFSLASSEKRLYACAIDLLLLMIVLALLHQSQFLLAVQAIYFPFCWWRFNGKTVGNTFMHIQVVGQDEKSLGIKTVIIRCFFFSSV
jgi:uncharacterized RDD family membrane protein YckC